MRHSGRHMRAGEIRLLMARAALLHSHTVAIGAAPHVHGVLMAVVSLPREVTLRMTIHAARVTQDRDERGEQGSIATCRHRSNCRRCRLTFRRADPTIARHRSRQAQSRRTDSTYG